MRDRFPSRQSIKTWSKLDRMEWTRTDGLLVGIGIMVFGCGWAIERQLVRIAKESTTRHATLESCRVLLKYIAENMQRGEKTELFSEAINDHIKKIFER